MMIDGPVRKNDQSADANLDMQFEPFMSSLNAEGYWTQSFGEVNQKMLASTPTPASRLNKVENFQMQLMQANTRILEENYLRQAVEAGELAAKAYCSIQTSQIYDLQDRLNQASQPCHSPGPKTSLG
ncbi:hypothetical protein M422DRAFT_51034 [Sphaerobolus stellatus SS14]|uniref:Unplaced genomic scaffold SPHSTscaffold_102, whole genome shotgun sequence n=1 Tax=Sphaerobolus stellatus (strain SS14) TaxID=990650 RepID=A0A0C9V4A0_SPHS4|nr:hypothetical protein M422DRAFT_51034 [Sphaerobolus stellatus SS14]